MKAELEHAIYGSVSGLRDYRILAASAGFDDRFRQTVVHYASLEGSALSERFPPIFNFFRIGSKHWAFSRSIYLGPTSRGNDYLVHTIVLNEDALERIDYKPFRLADAGDFGSEKPAQGTILLPIDPDAVPVRAVSAPRIDTAAIAACLRALARRPLRLRVSDDADAAGICRAIHESLPPTDRMNTAFCTRFSYGRQLDFQLAAFVAADQARTREHAGGNAELANFPPPSAAAADVYDQWVGEVRDNPDFDLVELSILAAPRKTFAQLEGVRKLRLWTEHDAAPPAGDLRELEESAALVLHPRNRNRASMQGLLPGALAVNLARQVEEALRTRQTFEQCARDCSEMRPLVRRDAARWIRTVSAAATQAWIAEMLLLLPDADLAAVMDTLGRRGLLAQLQGESSVSARSFLGTVMARLRDRFVTEGASAIASFAVGIAAERDVLSSIVRVMEETARHADRARQVAWLLAIVRGVARQTGLAGEVPARILLANGLLPLIDDPEESAAFAPALFAMEEKLAAALASAPQSIAMYYALADVAHGKLLHAWTPSTPSAIDVLNLLLLGASARTAFDAQSATAVRLTTISFMAAMLPSETRVALSTSIVTTVARLVRAAVSEMQAVLLIRTLRKLSRGSAQGILVPRKTALGLRNAVRSRTWTGTFENGLCWQLGVDTLSVAAASEVAA
ncbi:MAG: hypothetical protein M3P06_03025 [Acidobacteriota bacterium]|nr:hypothetical protein [Acidobacteriota bacterium]